MGSEPGTLVSTDWKKIGTGAWIACLGFLITYAGQSILPQIDQTNTTGMLAVAGISVAINFLRKLITTTK